MPNSPMSKTGDSLMASGGLGRSGSMVISPMRERFCASRPVT
jgi:hypothetical protein